MSFTHSRSDDENDSGTTPATESTRSHRAARPTATRRRLLAGTLGVALLSWWPAAGTAQTTPSTEWFGGTERDEFLDVLATDDGGVLLAGRSTEEVNDVSTSVGWAVKLDADREVEWNRTYVSAHHADQRDGEVYDAFEFVVPDGDGGYLLGGWSHDMAPDDRSGWVVAVDADGTERWERRFRRLRVNSFQEVFSDATRIDGGYRVAGLTIGEDDTDETAGDGWVVELDDEGDVVAEQTYNTVGETHEGYSEDERHDAFRAMCPTGDGGYVLVGEASPDGASLVTDSAGWVVAVDADGTERWSETYRLADGEDHEFLDVVRADDGGYVLAGVAGTDGGRHRSRTVGEGWAVKIDAEGAVEWEASPGGDGFRGVVATDPGYLLVGSRDDTAWAVTVDDEGETTTPEYDDETPESAYAAVVPSADGHLAVGSGRNADAGDDAGSIDGLVATLAAEDSDGEDETDGQNLDDEDDDGDSDAQSTFEVLSTTGNAELHYRFTVDGEVSKAARGINEADREDQIVSCSDGSATVVGAIGGRGGDVFAVTGSVTRFERVSGPAAYELRLDGEDVTDELL